MEWSAVSVAASGRIPVEERGIGAGGRILILFVGPGCGRPSGGRRTPLGSSDVGTRIGTLQHPGGVKDRPSEDGSCSGMANSA